MERQASLLQAEPTSRAVNTTALGFSYPAKLF
jgi:hypothetical protein